jgi:hypothetical protein
MRQTIEPDKRAVAVAWLFHLIGDLRQPLHTIQRFTREYPHGIATEMKSPSVLLRAVRYRHSPTLGLVDHVNKQCRST